MSVTPNRTPDSNGWYNRAVGFSASGSNYGPSGAGSCDADTSYDGPDSASASVLMSCTDGAGNSGSGSARFMYDDTAPSVTVSLARGADHNGWHNHAVGYGVSARSDATSGIASCDASDTYSGPDDATASVSRTCTDVAGNVGSDTALFKYDATAPADVATTLNRVADHNGWYNAPVGWTTNGDDLTSGIDTCDSDTYNGPDGTGLTVSGRCVDKAGNPSASVSAAFKYDNTNPNVSGTLARAADHNGWYNTSVSYSFASSSTDDTSGIDSASCTSGTYNGPDGSSVTVTGTCSDNAGNSANGSTPPFKYDNTDPTLAPTISPNPVLLNGSATASANANDATSGVDSSSCDPVNTGTIGANQSVSCSATDKAGNSNTANATYSVKADFNGFLQPIDGHSVNTGKYGRTYPIKWQLRDSSGALISDSAAQLLVGTMTGGQKAVSCTSFDLTDTDALEASTTGNTALRYDATSDQFIYNYKAPS
ncbi:MAG TPA: PxKF domain-containing protein, partial [Pseudonocardiaceae bacterium]|nr:PxKF domain-containing protein [Pseudonocardiaceae bacterium]